MHRNLNHHFNNGNAQIHPDPPYLRTSLRRHIEEKWLRTLIGIIGFFAGIFIIIENEAKAVQVSRFLDEALSLVTPVVPEADVDKGNIGKLVLMTGRMSIHEPLTEVDYGISVLAVRLFRNVQMYQWVETESDVVNSEGHVITTNYNYHTEWQNRLIDSHQFATSVGHWNPKEFPIKHRTQVNENVKIGKYYLGLDLKKKFNNFIPITGDERPERPDIKLHAGLYYHCQDIWKPEVGDIRVQFSYAGHHGQVITVIAKLNDSLTLVPYPVLDTQDNILMLRLGQYSPEDMFALGHSHNKFLNWMYRGAGWLLLYLSCVCLTSLLQMVVSQSAFLQDILPVSHSSLKMTVSMSMTLLATALAWVWYRPVLGFGLIIITIFLLFFTKWCSRNFPPQRYNRL